MNARAPRVMSADDFLVWCLDQEGRWELVRGVPIQMMTGATRRHDTIVTRIIVALDRRLRGSRCSPQTADQALRVDRTTARRPDVTVDCGPTADDALESSRPTVAFEVLSPSTRKTDRFRKLEEYKTVESVMHVALVDPDQPIVLLFSRAPDGTWSNDEIEGFDRSLPLTALSIEIPLAEIYDGLSFARETGS